MRACAYKGDYDMKPEVKSNKSAAIRCPHCGWEYHPSEIYVGNELWGVPDSVVKDALGKILYEDYADGDEPQSVEHFECENCGKPFVIEANLSFKTKKEEEELDFSEQYVSLLDD